MQRSFLPSIIASLLLVPALAAWAGNRNELERRLRNEYEGKVAALQAITPHADIQVTVPREEAGAFDAEVPFRLLIKKLRLRTKELELRAHRIYFYQDSKGEIRAFQGPEGTYGLRWKGSALEESQLREALQRTFSLVNDLPAQWPSYWPPPSKEDPPKAPGGKEPSKEAAPGIFSLGSDIILPECEFCPERITPRQLEPHTYRVW